MKKLSFALSFLLLMVGAVGAQDKAVPKEDPKAKTLMIRGTLIDTSCYFEEGQREDDHDGMAGCGKDCLESGVPAGVLVGDKVYILIFPAKAFEDYVGQTVEIKGQPYGDNLIHPLKASVVDKGGKKPIKLDGFEMM